MDRGPRCAWQKTFPSGRGASYGPLTSLGRPLPPQFPSPLPTRPLFGVSLGASLQPYPTTVDHDHSGTYRHQKSIPSSAKLSGECAVPVMAIPRPFGETMPVAIPSSMPPFSCIALAGAAGLTVTG